MGKTFDAEQTMDDMRNRMRFLIRNRKITIHELCERAGLPKNKAYVYKWLNGEKDDVTLMKIVQLSEGSDVSIDFLLAGIGSGARLSTLGAEELTIDEKDLYVCYRKLPEIQQRKLFHTAKSMVPTNAFYKIDFIKRNKGDFDAMDAEIRKMFADVGNRIRKMTAEKGLYLKDIYKEIGIEASFFSKMLTGERHFMASHFLAICRIFDILPGDLLFSYAKPDVIPSMTEDASDLIVYYRMLGIEDKGRILAVGRDLLVNGGA